MGTNGTAGPKYEIRHDKRIVALRDFGHVEKGDVGGFVDGDHNLSNFGTCWIFDDARVTGDACVIDDASVMDDAHVYDSAVVSERARVTGAAQVYGNASISGRASVTGNAQVYGHAAVYGNAYVYNEAHVYDDAHVVESASVCYNARVHGTAKVHSCMMVSHDADVAFADHLLFITGFVPWDVTVYRTTDGFRVQAGCQNFTLEEMEDRALSHRMQLTDARRLLWDAIVAQTKTWHNK